MFIITIIFHQVTMMKGLSQVSHYSGETAIRIDCNQLGKNPNTNSHFPRRGHVRSPLVQLRTQLCGFGQCRNFRDWPAARMLRPSLPLGSHLAPRTSLLPPVCTLGQNDSRPKLSYSALRSEWVIQPAKWEATFKMTLGPTMMWSLSGSDEITSIILQPRFRLASIYIIT